MEHHEYKKVNYTQRNMDGTGGHVAEKKNKSQNKTESKMYNST